MAPKYVISQKVATLLAQITKDNPSSVFGTLDFLTDTLINYSNFRKLNRYLGLTPMACCHNEA